MLVHTAVMQTGSRNPGDLDLYFPARIHPDGRASHHGSLLPKPHVLANGIQIFGRQQEAPMSDTILVPVAPGEMLDKITILEIKLERIEDAAKRANVELEYTMLQKVRGEKIPESPALADAYGRLKAVNETLWVIEDDIRDCERGGDFGPKFIELARSVYRVNDQRAAIKKEINLLLGSALVEEKSYKDYMAPDSAGQ